MLVYVFRDSKQAGVRTETIQVTEIIEYCARFAERWSKQSQWVFDDLPAGARDFVETRLIVPPHNPNGKKPKITHALADRERSERDTVFIGTMPTEQYYEQKLTAAAAWLKRQSEIRQRAREMNAAATQQVNWEDLPAKLQARCGSIALSPHECWNWQPIENPRRLKKRTWPAPYREFYARIKGPISDGVVLRHKCDNRQCMNPNHLEPGTLQENVQDMIDRRRHARASNTRKSTKRG